MKEKGQWVLICMPVAPLLLVTENLLYNSQNLQRQDYENNNKSTVGWEQ